jgi:hypothetical protein
MGEHDGDDHMFKDRIKAELSQDPFVPLRLHLKNGKIVSIPFREAAHIMATDMLVLKGANLRTHRAKGYTTFPYDDVVRIEQQRGGRGGQRRRKAS